MKDTHYMPCGCLAYPPALDGTPIILQATIGCDRHLTEPSGAWSWPVPEDLGPPDGQPGGARSNPENESHVGEV